MTTSLILQNGSLEARRRVYQHYGVPDRCASPGYLLKAIASVGTRARWAASAIARVPQRVDHAVSRLTGIDLPWSSSVLTLGAAGCALAYRSPIRSWAAWHFHDRPGHLTCFKAVNEAIDSVAGANHRLKYGHTVFWLPGLIRSHGLIAVPGYATHVLQDFTTVAGIPLFPGARLAAIGLGRLGLARSVATSLVTVNLAQSIAAVSVGLLLYEATTIGCEVFRQIRSRSQDDRNLDPERAAELVSSIRRNLDRIAPRDAAPARPRVLDC
jgi:hypothetical protein